MGVLIAVYIVSGLAWGLVYWLGLRDGRVGVSRRAAWSRAFGVFLLLVIGFGFRDFAAILVSALVLPCCYLLGWNRMSRFGLAART
ncbi:MAG: hypothetical protein FD171_268 [Actinobacteria bacterium]|nr:MAG: hypothetical protein FD171_268 [Actinomycetota bacterium]